MFVYGVPAGLPQEERTMIVPALKAEQFSAVVTGAAEKSRAPNRTLRFAFRDDPIMGGISSHCSKSRLLNNIDE
jgi:hypothetical protein